MQETLRLAHAHQSQDHLTEEAMDHLVKTQDHLELDLQEAHWELACCNLQVEPWALVLKTTLSYKEK